MTTPNLEGRQSKCMCGNVRPSSLTLGHFEYKGPGSRQATETCGHCGYYESVHTGTPRNPDICLNFIPHGPYEFDSHWDGCGGTD